MPAVKALTWTVLVIGVMGTGGRAAADSIDGGRWSASLYYYPVGAYYAPTGSTAVSSGARGTAGGSDGASSQPGYDARLEMDSGPFPGIGSLATSGGDAWYNSSQVQQLNGGPLSSSQRDDFSQTVLDRVKETFNAAGIPVSLTTDPSASAAHTFSIVSNTSNGDTPGAVGMTTVGGNGVGFIDKLAQYATSMDQLEWAVAHNAAHELMHAFGVAAHDDKTGSYIDSAVTPWTTMTNPSATFSPAATADLLAQDFRATTTDLLGHGDGQEVSGTPVPEPSTLALWGVAGAALLLRVRRRGRD